MPRTERIVLAIAASVGVLGISLPWILQHGLTLETFTLVSTNFGTGVIATVLVIIFTRMFASPARQLGTVAEVREALKRGILDLPASVAVEIDGCLQQGEEMRAAGVDRIFETREAAYSDIAREMEVATQIHIVTGSLHSFWSLHRELLLQRQRDGCDLRIALLQPGSVHAQARALLDVGIRSELQFHNGYASTINQIFKEIRGSTAYDFCPASSVWIIGDVLYLTPYLYALRGGQGLCIKLRRTPDGLYYKVKASAEKLISDNPRNPSASTLKP